VQQHFGTIANPAHAGPVEAKADQVADGTFDGTGADVEVIASEAVVFNSATETQRHTAITTSITT
jgi:hypothetical protein